MNPSHSSGATFSFCRPWCKGKFRQLFLLAALWPLLQNHPGRSNGGWYQRKALPGNKFPQTLAPHSSGSSTVQRFPQPGVQITGSGCASTWTSATNTATPPPCPPAGPLPHQRRSGPGRLVTAQEHRDLEASIRLRNYSNKTLAAYPAPGLGRARPYGEPVAAEFRGRGRPRPETDAVLANLQPPYRLAGLLLYGCGLRLAECVNLRVHCFNLEGARQNSSGPCAAPINTPL
jgi:hypothetical protein